MNACDEDRAFQARLGRAKIGDAQAFRELILAEAPAIESFVNARLATQHQKTIGVDDVLQETLLAIHRNLQKAEFDSKQSFSSWCIRISENRMLDLVRQSRRKKRGGNMNRLSDGPNDGHRIAEQLPGNETKASVKLRRQEEADVVRKALDELPTVQRNATELKYLDDRNNQSIARILNKSTQAVEGLLKRAKAKLRRILSRSD